jgi:hypothetical protein
MALSLSTAPSPGTVTRILAVDDVAALQAAADRLSPTTIRKQLDYWTLILGPKFSKKERDQMTLSRFYAIAQIEYCRNFIFKRHFPIHKIFERSCEIGLWRLTANRISEIFGVRLNKRLHGKLATVIDQIEHGHHVFRAYWKCGQATTDKRRWNHAPNRAVRISWWKIGPAGNGITVCVPDPTAMPRAGTLNSAGPKKLSRSPI